MATTGREFSNLEAAILFGLALGLATAMGLGIYAYFSYRPPKGDEVPLSDNAMRWVHEQDRKQRVERDLGT